MVKMIIPGQLPGLNDITDTARANIRQAARQKREYTDRVAWCAKSAKLPHMEKVDVKITWFEPNKKRDKDNINAGIKFILDGLVVAGVLDNDGWKQIGTITHDVQVDKLNPRVEVELQEV